MRGGGACSSVKARNNPHAHAQTTHTLPSLLLNSNSTTHLVGQIDKLRPRRHRARRVRALQIPRPRDLALDQLVAVLEAQVHDALAVEHHQVVHEVAFLGGGGGVGVGVGWGSVFER